MDYNNRRILKSTIHNLPESASNALNKLYMPLEAIAEVLESLVLEQERMARDIHLLQLESQDRKAREIFGEKP